MDQSDRSRVPPFRAMDVLRLANEREAAGERIIHMELGQPRAPAPEAVRRAAAAAIGKDALGYTEAKGIPPLRDAIAGYYKRTFGLDVDPGRIIATTGSSGGFSLAFLGAFDTGAKVALTRPFYPAYPNIMQAYGIEPVFLDAGAQTGFRLDPERVREAAKAGLDGLLIASPANPTGAVIAPEDLAAIAAICEAYDVRLISDEIYHGIAYTGPADTILSHTDQAIVANSFSKYYCMTGWRIGWMVLPESLVRPIECLAQSVFICAPAVSQAAALAAFDPASQAALDEIVEDYARSRTLLMEALPKLGFKDLSPADGAFYVYADISAFGQPSAAFCRSLLLEAGIAITPGEDFDDTVGDRTVRFSFAAGESAVSEALTRLQSWLEQRPRRRFRSGRDITF